MTIIESTDEQRAIYALASSGNGNIIVEALAGSGKSTVLLELLCHVPQKTVLLTAFNKRIAEDLQERLPPKVKGSIWCAKTYHAVGFNILNSHKPGLKLSKSATEDLVNDAALSMAAEGFKLNFNVRRAATRLLRLYKETHSLPEIEHDHAKEFGHSYSMFTELADADIDRACYLVQRAYDFGLYLDDRTTIDFCDMVWLPVVLGLKPPSRYQAVFVDEAQDLSLLQWELIKSLVAPNGRVVCVLDRKQAIYEWRGAAGGLVIDELKAGGAIEMPLNTTFRCSRAVVQEAQQIVPAIKPSKHAPSGSVGQCTYNEMVGQLRAQRLVEPPLNSSRFVLSRTNADILNVALQLWVQDIPFRMLGAQEIVEPLIHIYDSFDKSSMPRFIANLTQWAKDEVKRAEAANSPAWADRIEQQFAALMTIANTLNVPSRIQSALSAISGQSTTKHLTSNLTISTVHKAKGLEADHVYLLRNSFERHQEHRKEPVTQEQLNTEYVAITRAKMYLTWVTGRSVTEQFSLEA